MIKRKGTLLALPQPSRRRFVHGLAIPMAFCHSQHTPHRSTRCQISTYQESQ